MEKIKILLVDDKPALVRGLAMRLSLEEDLLVVGSANDGSRALEMAANLHPDVVVMDVRMPGMDGITAAGRLHELAPQIVVILLSLYDDPRLIALAREAGVSAYVEKRGGAARLIDAIRSEIEARTRRDASERKPEDGRA